MARTAGLNGLPSAELLLLIDGQTGTLLLEHPERVPAQLLAQLGELAGEGTMVGCATPRTVLPPPIPAAGVPPSGPTVRITGYYHGSLVEGPGRRSSVLFAGCPLACAGCWVPHLHAADAGAAVPVARLADALMDPAHARVGVSILGGEPFAQPDGLLALVGELRRHGCSHIVVYSGYTHERLRSLAHRRPSIGAVLDEVDVLIDGPYVESLADGAGAWTGSSNQRVIDLAPLRRDARAHLSGGPAWSRPQL